MAAPSAPMLNPPQRQKARETPRPKFTFRRSDNQFDFDRSLIPAETDYQWRVYSVMGMVQRQAHIIDAQNYWEPVPADRHPEIATEDPDNKKIIVGGQILMQRPMEISIQAREMHQEDARAARRDSRTLIGETPEGTLQRTAPRVKRTFERMPVPSDEEN